MEKQFAGSEFSIGRRVEVYAHSLMATRIEHSRLIGTGTVIGWGTESRLVTDEDLGHSQDLVGQDTVMFVELDDGRVWHACPANVRFLQPQHRLERRVMVSRPGRFRSGEAIFRGFGNDFEESEGGVGNYSTAIVEWPDGSLDNVPVERARFLDTQTPDHVAATETGA